MREEKSLHLWTAHIKVIAIGAGDEIVDVFEVDNMIMLAAKNLLRDALRAGTNAQINYLALGTSNTAVANTQTQLGAEAFRKQVTQRVAGATGAVTTTTYVSPPEGNFSIQEIGWFAGSGASGAVNSGVMISRILYARAKTNLEALQIERTDTIT